MTTTTALPLAA
jgi:[histone H3]-lysine4 N-trimethyltransferase SETD1